MGTFGRKLGLTCATWPCAGASAAEVGPKTGPMWATWARTHESHSGKNVSFQRLALGPQNWPGLGPAWAPALGRSCFQMRPTYGQVAPCWSQVGPKLESELSGRKLGPCWPKLTPSRANVAAMSDRNGAFGRCWADMQNVQITANFWRPVPGEHGPPAAEAVPV